MNGTVTTIYPNGFEVQVGQSFGNCPQYIQARMFEMKDGDGIPKPIHSIKALGEAERSLVAIADTFFIATAYQAESASAASGVDVSHRGGRPGFIRIDDEKTLTIPDFSGNNHFNTFGNLELNPQAGLLFIDFDRGNLLYLTGAAQVIWEGVEISTFPGAERLLRFQLEKGSRVEGSLPLRWSEPKLSLFLAEMSSL
ncbi:MAG: hypothetical protein HC879_13765 [Leptolyngbyaceae cyanobacterium SL_5_9]|nr:hypothetical protein [Leptolyngbyaceae cyanobacterium SL_5_9]